MLVAVSSSLASCSGILPSQAVRGERRDAPMKVLRWLEALSGLLAALVGGVGLVYLLIVPIYSGESCYIPFTPPVCTTGTATFLQVTGTTGVVHLCLIAFMLLGVATAATWHSWTGRPGSRVVLWGFTAVLPMYALLAQFSTPVLPSRPL